ncbi:MAG: YkgJ family cysteine cluster protein [Alphaproteobacteria bacterium]|nr:YkgJ family cysteine cluster protein [Alphaproteobacteria bacterium]
MSEKTLWDTFVEGRECDGCSICCRLPGIEDPELSKPPYVSCEHCGSGGCGIYESRPKICREWFCLWRRLKEMPDDARPDKIGAMVSLEHYSNTPLPFEKLYVIVRAVDDESVFDSPCVKNLIAMFVDEGSLPVWLGFNGKKKLVHPNLGWGQNKTAGGLLRRLRRFFFR